VETPARSDSRRIWRPWMFATLAYLLVTIIVTYPVSWQLNTDIAGERTGDSLEFVWSTWWWKHALLDLHQNPIDISVINYPQGMQFPLLPAMSQAFILALPLTALTSPVFAYNIIFLLSFVLSGLTGYILCTELSGDSLAGFVGGLIWTFFPNKMGHALAGHLFFTLVFMFPLVAWSLLCLLKKPTTRNAIVTGLVVGLSATLHPIYLPYFIGIFVAVFVGHGVLTEGRAFWGQGRARALAVAAGVAGLIVGALLAPALLDAIQGNLRFLAVRGATGFAFDLLAYIVPAPNNPLVLRSPLAGLSRRVVLSEYESIAYLGWLPLILSIAGARARWAESRPWVILAAVAGILALGPLLKIGGGLVHAPVEDGWYPIVMPYAFIGSLPFFQWSRTPGRLDILVMMSLAVLSAFGFKLVSRRFALPTRCRIALLIAVSAFITAEYLVKFPFPTIPADAPQPLVTLRTDTSEQAVIDLPVPDNSANLRSLYWQTYHQHPLVGGRVYRDVPGGQTIHSFVSHLLLSTESADIVPIPTNDQRHAVLTSMGVGWVLYDALADEESAAHTILNSRLGSSVGATDELALFTVPPADLHSDDVVWALGDGWNSVQDWGGQVGRWFCGQGYVYLYSGGERTERLAFTSIPGQTLRRLTVRVNGTQVGRFSVGDWTEYHTEPVQLIEGLNVVDFIDERGAQEYVGDPRCAGGSPVSGPYPYYLPCDSADVTPRELSLVVSNLHLIPETEMLPIEPLDMQFGDSIELLGFTAPTQVKPGEGLTLHLVWRALGRIPEDLVIFTHLIDSEGTLAAQDDAWPVGGMYPTSHWKAGEVVAYNVTIRVPADAAPGTYRLQVGIYRWPSIERLPVSGTAQTQDSTVQLGDVEIER